MKKYNFDVPLLDLDGNPILNSPTIGKILASFIIGAEANSKSMKWMDWARSAHKHGVLVLDDSDADELKDWVSTNNSKMTHLVVAEMLQIFKNGVEFIPDNK